MSRSEEVDVSLLQQELEEYEPNVYWAVLDVMEDRDISEDSIGSIEILEPIDGVEVTLYDEEDEQLLSLLVNPETGEVLEVSD